MWGVFGKGQGKKRVCGEGMSEGKREKKAEDRGRRMEENGERKEERKRGIRKREKGRVWGVG